MIGQLKKTAHNETGRILIVNGHVLDPANQVDKPCDILVEDGIIQSVGNPGIEPEDTKNAYVLDAAGCWVTPGFIDLHTHLREPGQTHKETIKTASLAAAAGGFTTVCAMPNTTPYADSVAIIRWIQEQALKTSVVHVLPVACITVGQIGKKLTPMRELVKAGACAFSEDGRSVADAMLMKEALVTAKALNIPILSHCEDLNRVAGGVVHAGIASEKFGLPGISAESESIIVERDIRLAIETGARLHICHVSTADSVALLRKARCSAVTGEVCPHHFVFCDEDITADDGNFKMNPPLRSREDLNAVLKGLNEGTLSVIATDHAPHALAEKNRGLLLSAFGVTGLETAASAGITYLVNKKILSPVQWVQAMTVNPARVLGIDKGTLSPGAAADITVIDPHLRGMVDVGRFASMGQNSPFKGKELTGKVIATLVDGQMVYHDEQGEWA